MLSARAKRRNSLTRSTPVVRPAQGSVQYGSAVVRHATGLHPFTRSDENTELFAYEQGVKESFARIEQVLRRISSLQHEDDFVARAQQIASRELGFELPGAMLEDGWIRSLDMGKLYASCVFETFKRMSDDFFERRPLGNIDEAGFQRFIEQCGFHTVDVSPCADGRLAHVIRYVLRLPYKGVRRKSYAGAMFDIEDSLQKWIETEMRRHHEARPNSADAATRYLKIAVYHHSSAQPSHEGCAAHGSDTRRAAEGALARLLDFRTAVEKGFCCGASIDLLLIGIDTDNDVIRLHLPDGKGEIDPESFIDAASLYDATRYDSGDAEAVVKQYIEKHCRAVGVTIPSPGMVKFAASLLCNNISQIDYVRSYHNGGYSDIGHQERFIGMGIGFEEIQLRNLTYFAYLKTVEEGSRDMDVGVKIFSGLNVSRGLPIPVVIRYDYHGEVPGARDRAVARCRQLEDALVARFSELAKSGLLHTLLMVRDCQVHGQGEVVGSSLQVRKQDSH